MLDALADAVGTLRLLEAIRILKLEQKTRFYQASTSELYGKVTAGDLFLWLYFSADLVWTREGC